MKSVKVKKGKAAETLAAPSPKVAESSAKAPAPVTGVAAARRFAIEAARLMSATRCHQVSILDVTGISTVSDFLVIATGTSTRQMHSVADDVIELGTTHQYKDFTHAGYAGETWVCLDFIDVVVHLFNQESRMYYDLDNLWGDAKQVAWEDEPAAK